MPYPPRLFSSHFNRFSLWDQTQCGWFRSLGSGNRYYSDRNEQGQKPKLTVTDKKLNWKLLASHSTYDPKYVEDKQLCQALWDRLQISKPETVLSRNSSAPVFSMLLPPPNVTGSLHIGHALTCTVQDALARFNRMQGKAVLWIPGMDHAGIATQAVVERELRNRSQRTASAPGTTPVTNPRLLLGRQAFVEEVWKWKKKQSKRIREQLDSLGLSMDWSREFFTLDSKHSHAVTEAFVRLYDAGLLYRDKSIVSWCCHFQSVISDIEVDTVQLERATEFLIPGYSEPQTFGIMDYFAYPLAGSDGQTPSGNQSIVVATTRLETMLADTALVVHPDDPRYMHLIGRHAIHPFCPEHRRLPIVADAQLVDRTKGTGVVKLSPGHSPADWEAARRLGLPVLNMLDDAGRVNQIGGEFEGLPRFVARRQLVKRLTELGLYRKREDISCTGQITSLPICSRSGDVIEPVVREQWFLRTEQLAEQAVQAVREGKLKLHPPYHNAIWNEWLSPANRRDWCVSRQLWWGHRIPAFRLKRNTNQTAEGFNSAWLVARNETEAKAQFIARDSSLSDKTIVLEQDPDVLDTWFSSALLPFTTLGWPHCTDDLKQFYPMSLLETGQDILFFWVARMVILGLQLTNALPFSEVLLHGLVCDARGQKMSKSKGNVADPLDLVHGTGSLPKHLVGSNIEAIGADALRASLLSSTLGQPQVSYNPESAVEMRRFCNKIWQTGRFALLRIQTDQEQQLSSLLRSDLHTAWERMGSTGEITRLVDLWLVSRLADLVRHILNTWSGSNSTSGNDSTTASHLFTLHSGIQQLHHWWTQELCSVHLEVIKYREKVSPNANCSLFLLSLLTGLHMLHPVMPHVTELVWQGLKQAANATSQPEAKNLLPETALVLQSFPQSDWFRFLERFGHDNSTGVSQLMSELLSSASQANAWRVLLRPRPKNGVASVTHSSDSFPALRLMSLTISPDTEEVMSALTRLTVGDIESKQSTGLRLAIGSNWFLSVDPEAYDLDWTRNELKRRLESQSKRRDQLASQLDKSASQGLDTSRSVLQKLRGFEQRIGELEKQLQLLGDYV